MKSILTLIVILALPFSVLAQGLTVGNGGDVYSLEFVEVGEEVHSYLEDRQILDIDLKQLRHAIEVVKIESTDQKLELGGVPKDAINYPSENRIIFNFKRWRVMSEDEKAVLVLHEYLGILLIDDIGFKLSKAVLNKSIFQKTTVEAQGPFVVNFTMPTEYQLQARLLVQSYGRISEPYDASNEKLQMQIEMKGQKKIFKLQMKGRVISATSRNSDIDPGIYLQVLEPIRREDGSLDLINSSSEGSEYIRHVIKTYYIQFYSPIKGDVPESIEVQGPISNLAG